MAEPRPQSPTPSDPYADVTAEEIQDAYEKGYLTAKERNVRMRRKAQWTMDELLDEKGYAGAFLGTMLQHINKGWENIKAAATSEPADPLEQPGKAAKDALYNSGLAMWGQIEVLGAGFMAFGEVNGAVAERWALSMGAWPGVASMLNIAVDIGSGVFPVGTASKFFVKGVQGLQQGAALRAMKGSFKAEMKQAGKEAGKELDVAAKAPSAEAEEAVAEAIAKGLETEGVVGTVFSKAAKAPTGIPPTVQRVEEAGATASTVAKPHGLYTTPGHLESPHADLGGTVSRFTTNPEARVLRIDETVGGKDVVMRRGAMDAGAGVHAARQSLGPEEFARLKGLSKTDLIEEAKKIDPTVDWSKYFDKQEVMEGIGGTLARKAGYDAIWLPDKTASEFSEYVGLTTRAFVSKATPPAVGLKPSTAQAPSVIEAPAVAIRGARELSVKDQFAADLTKFRREMGSLTETQKHKQTADLAEALGYNLEDLKHVIPGQALNEAEILAYLNALKPQVERAKALAAKVVGGTEADANAFAQHMSEFFTVAPKFRGAAITGGRATEIQKEEPAMKQISEMLMGWDPESIAKGNFQAAITTMAEDFLVMSERQGMALGIQAQGGFARFKEGIWPMAREFYINLLLARPVTQVRNIVGNSFAASNAVLETMTGALFSADRKAGLTGKDGLYMLKGMHAALGDAFKAYGKAFMKLSPEEISKLDYVPGAIPGPLGRIIRTPGSALAGMDVYFKTILRRASYYSEAMRDGTHMVKAGTLPESQLADFVARRINYPTKTMLDNAEAFALSNTFQNDLGTIGKAVRSFSQMGPMVLFFPFMKTPINLAKYAWNRTPGLQLLSKSLRDDIAEGGVKADMAIGRLTLSNLQAMFIFELAKEGLITGSGPVDPGLRAAWFAAGNKPYSVKTPKGWMPISNFEPANTPLGLVADYTQIMDSLDDPSAEQGAMAIAFTLMKGLADKTYWRSMNDLTDVASGLTLGHEPSVKAREFFFGPLVTVASGGPLVQAVTRAIDPIMREARDPTLSEARQLLNLWISKVPGYSKTLPPRTDGYGDPILAPIAVGSRWTNLVNPITVTAPTEDRVKKEGGRLEVRLPKFPSTIGGSSRSDFDIRNPFPEDKLGVELTARQRFDRTQIYRNLIRHPHNGIERALLDTPEYQETTRAGQRDLFTQFLSESWTASQDLLLIKHPTLGEKLIQSEAKRVMPLLQEADRQQLQRDTQQATEEFRTMNPQARDELLRWGLYGDEEQE